MIKKTLDIQKEAIIQIIENNKVETISGVELWEAKRWKEIINSYLDKIIADIWKL